MIDPQEKQHRRLRLVTKLKLNPTNALRDTVKLSGAVAIAIVFYCITHDWRIGGVGTLLANYAYLKIVNRLWRA